MQEMTTEEVQILQYVTEQRKSVHKLAIFQQIKQYLSYGGKSFNRDGIQSYLDRLVFEKYLRYIQEVDSYAITPTGDRIVSDL